jgi:hypothetical protein
MTIERRLKGKDRFAVLTAIIVGMWLGSTGADTQYKEGFQAGQTAVWSQQGGVK